MKDKITHFGQFIRWNRVNRGLTTEAVGRAVGITGRRVIAIEALAEPNIHPGTLVGLAKLFDIEPEKLDSVWRATPVRVTPRKIRPAGDESAKFAATCARHGLTPQQGLRRLRAWVVQQDAARQDEVMTTEPTDAGEPTFTALVDHLQDPSAVAKGAVGRKAATAAKAAARAAKGGGTRR